MKSNVFKIHANFAKVLDAPLNTNRDEMAVPARSVVDHWGNKSNKERKEFLGKAHVDAQRFLSQRGVWDSVAQVLERHFTMTLAQEREAPTAQPESTCSSSSITSQPYANTTATQQDVDDIIDNVMSAMCKENATEDEQANIDVVPDAEVTSCSPATIKTAHALAKVVSTTSLKGTETANVLANTMSATTRTEQQNQGEEPSMEISMVPNPLSPVPNPLSTLSGPAACNQSTALYVSVPVAVVSSDESTSGIVAPVSPLSDTEYSDRASPPVWCLDEVTYYGDDDKNNNKVEGTLGRENWEFDPLTLLA